jgi:hypothetical protein
VISKWYELKPKAIVLRKNGTSIREVEKILKIPRSTLSGWFRNIKLTKSQKIRLDTNWQKALYNARKHAVIWHNHQKELRMKIAQDEAIQTLNKIKLKDKSVLELALAMIYMGEGSKKNVTSLGNTNPLILKFFIKSLSILYKIDKTEIRCELHLRNDQNAQKMIKYWSKEISIPKNRFTATKDKRPIKSKTYPNYMGVCVVRCGKIAIQRKLGFIGEGFCNKIVELDA